MTPTLAKMQYHSLSESLPVVSKMIDATKDREIRNRLVMRLALLDQKLAELRDALGLPGLTVDGNSDDKVDFEDYR